MTTVEFSEPLAAVEGSKHHGAAAIGNVDVTTAAIGALQDALEGSEPYERILLKAAAGAGKSFALRRMVKEAVAHPDCSRVGVTAFANKQVFPLAIELGKMLGKNAVCLMPGKDRVKDVPQAAWDACTVESDYKAVPHDVKVILGTTHKLEGVARWLLGSLGAAHNGSSLFDVLFVDEAWQLPLHRYRKIDRLAPIVVGVGDVGQLPPIDSNQNPWRGDETYNPYRAWPTAYPESETTWTRELPAVWRPTAYQLGLWRAFYDEWDELNCVAAKGDRSICCGPMSGAAKTVWSQVASGVPTLLEVEGLPEAEAADVDQPLLSVLEVLLSELLAAGFTLRGTRYDDHGMPGEVTEQGFDAGAGDPLIAVLATRNQAVDDATDMVERLVEKHSLPDGVIVASTVDSWQGQTNGITVALHPLSGAVALDEFNSAFGRLAVTCTRATHGLLVLSRAGLDDVLTAAAARPGTPLGEPGTRRLPRQTHTRILESFARGHLKLKATSG